MQSKYFVVVVSLCFFLSSHLIVAADNLVSEKNEPTEKEGSVSENQGKDIEAQSDYLKAKDKLFEQKYTEALVYLEKALKNDPQSAHLNNEISKVYAQIGEMDKAVVAAKKLLQRSQTKSSIV
ncbi:tetratricopeptide repeat protein [bacterium]|nr:tetratricopeptide repeat protein [bacterium]